MRNVSLNGTEQWKIETDTDKDKDDKEVTDHFDLMFNLFYFYECFCWSEWEVNCRKHFVSNCDCLENVSRMKCCFSQIIPIKKYLNVILQFFVENKGQLKRISNIIKSVMSDLRANKSTIFYNENLHRV